MKFFPVLCLVCTFGFNGGTLYGPSIISLLPKSSGMNSKQISSWQNAGGTNRSDSHEDSATSERKLLLKDYANFAVVMPIVEGRVWARANEIWRLTFPSFGEKSFTVEAPDNHGVVAVIQELDIKIRQRSTCNLYIKLGDADHTTQRICGKIEKGDFSADPKHLIGPRTFSSSSGKITFYFNAFPGLLGLDSHIRVAVAFTAYKEGCYFNDTDIKDTSVDPSDYKPCAMRGWQSTCIKSKLFCDNIINCGGKYDFEKDERDCQHNEIWKSIRKNAYDNLIPSISSTEAPTLSAETRYRLYSYFTSAVIGIIGICTLCFVIKYMMFRTCSDAAKVKSLVDGRNTLNQESELSDRNGNDPSEARLPAGSRELEIENLDGNGNNIRYKLPFTRPSNDNPPSYFELFPQTVEPEVSVQLHSGEA